MKKLLLSIFIMVMSVLITMPVNAETMKDVQAKGEFQSYRQLLNHPYTGLYDIYYKGNDDNAEIKIVTLFDKNKNDDLTFKYGDNKSITLTNKQWFDLFNDFSEFKQDANAIDKISGDFFTFWAINRVNSSPKEVAIKYITDKKAEVNKKVTEQKLNKPSEKTQNQNELKLSEEIIDISDFKEDNRYPTLNKLSKELQSIKAQREYEKVQLGLAQQSFFETYQSLKPTISVNNEKKEEIIGFIPASTLYDIGIGNNIKLSRWNNGDHLEGNINLYNKDANKMVYSTIIVYSTYFTDYREITSKNIRLRYDRKTENVLFNVKDLIRASIVNRLFAKDKDGNYIPMPYYQKSFKESFKEFWGF